MEIKEFIEKFLPEYEAIKNAEDVNLLEEERLFHERHFPEALQNFADRICEKQKARCAQSDLKKHAAVLFVEQPKIEEL
ncbi:MAG: hypothetical protein LBS69_12235 [Prevotellaceae bacterium]|jgi:hypothetical protein|nr:hypothetical protein [Prevotellaceae bacterium]